MERLIIQDSGLFILPPSQKEYAVCLSVRCSPGRPIGSQTLQLSEIAKQFHQQESDNINEAQSTFSGRFLS